MFRGAEGLLQYRHLAGIAEALWHEKETTGRKQTGPERCTYKWNYVKMLLAFLYKILYFDRTNDSLLEIRSFELVGTFFSIVQ